MPKDKNKLGERMKAYESNSETRLDRTLPFVIRLDGHSFSKFTKQFKKPYDIRIHNAMALTTADLVSYFNCTTGFTQSDEITLVFPSPVTNEDLEYEKENPNQKPKAMIFNGRIQKIASLAAGYCSARFNFHLNNQEIYDSDSDLLKKKIRAMEAFFDARIFNVNDDNELLNNILWRSRYDCERNSTSMLAQAHFSAKQLHGLSKKQQQTKLINEKQIDWNDEPNWFKYGALIKKELFNKLCKNPKTNEEVTAVRSRLVLKAFQLEKFDENLVIMLKSKTWEDNFNEFLTKNQIIVQSRIIKE